MAVLRLLTDGITDIYYSVSLCIPGCSGIYYVAQGGTCDYGWSWLLMLELDMDHYATSVVFVFKVKVFISVNLYIFDS